MEKLQILHTNDLHSHFENFPKIQRFLQNSRHQNELNGVNTLIIDDGDAADRQHPLTEATLAKANVDWLNEAGYDFVTIGNSEGLYYSHQELEQMYDQANFDVILANLYEANGELANFVQPYQIWSTRQGTKVGIIGMTAPYQLTYPLLDWKVKTVEEVLPQLIAKIRPKVDVLVLLSHMGLPTDRAIGEKYPQVDIIIGAHTHHLLSHGQHVNNSLLVAAQKYGNYVGQIDLILENHQIVQQTAKTLLVRDLPTQPDDEQVISAYERKGEHLLSQTKIAQLPTDFSTDLSAQHMLNAMKEATNCKTAMISSGLFLKDLPQGVVTANDLHQQLPHAIHLMKTKLRGSDFWRFIMEVEKNRGFLRNFPQKGMGFRGKIFGEIIFSGVEFDSRTQTVFYDGEPIKEHETYEIALLDHYYFIPFFPTLQIVGDNEFEYPDFLRTVLGKYLAKHFPLK